MEHHNRLLEYYKKDNDDNYLIEVFVKGLNDLYDKMDPSPMHERDVNKKVLDLLAKQIVVFPKEAKVKIVFHVPKKMKKKGFEDTVRDALRHSFRYDFLDNHIHMKRRIRKASRILLSGLVIFVVLVGTSLFMESLQSENFFVNLISEGFFIGAWVALWHPIDILLYEWIPLHEEKSKYFRLMNLDIEFRFV